MEKDFEIITRSEVKIASEENTSKYSALFAKINDKFKES